MYYVFGDCTLDTERYEFYRAGVRLPLRRKAFQLLTYLLAHCNRVVPKDELLEHLWPVQVIGDAALNSCLMAVRKAIGDSGQAPKYIQTLRGLGYRFVATVEVQSVTTPGHHAPVASVTSSPASQNHGEKVGDRPELAVLPCPVCQCVQSPGAMFCMACGTRLRQVCPSCGHMVRLPVTSCGACGQSLEETPELTPSAAIPSSVPLVKPPSSDPPVFEEEFKQVTVLCCGLAAARDLAAQHGPEAMYELMQAFFILAQDIVQCYEGTLTQFEGDSFVVVFGAPLAHEDHARRAVLAALDLKQRLRELPALRRQPQDGPLSVCIGLHTGQVVVGYLGHDARQLYTAAGETSHLASRLQQLAAPGTVLISEATYHFVQAEVQVETWESRARTLSAFPIPAYTVRGLRQRQAGVPGRSTRLLSPFVGRERELAMLHERLIHAESGQGQVVSIVGDPGMGKSRLLYEFRQSLTGKPLTYRQGLCFSYSRVAPYFLVQALLRQACGLTDTDSLDVVTAKMHAYLRAYGMVPEHEAPLLLDLLDVPTELAQLAQLSSEARKARTFILLHQLSLHDSQYQPLILAIENLHWIDATSEEWLASLVPYLASAAIFLVVTYRPEFRPPWLEQSAVTRLNLPRLLPQNSLRVVQAAAQTTLLPRALIEEMVAKAAGNPFFLEELAWTLKGHGDTASSLKVPDTIQAVLAARIDRLPPVAKQLLQTAAVIGADVPLSLLQALTAFSDDVLHRNLQHLQSTEFLHCTRLVPEPVYTFKHVLTQEVTYQSLLHRSRQQIHGQVAQVMVMQLPELVAAQPALLAHHYTEAGLNASAVEAWQRAGQLALERSAYVEAIGPLTTGLWLLTTLPDTPERTLRELDMWTALGAALHATKGPGVAEVEHAYTQAYKLCQQLGETPQLIPVLMGLCRYYQLSTEQQTARQLGEQLLSLAQGQHDTALLVVAHRALGQSLFYLGELVSARTHLEQALDLYNPQQHLDLAARYGADPGVSCFYYLAHTLWALGYADLAREKVLAMLALVQDGVSPFSRAVALFYVVRICILRGEVQSAREHIDALLTLSAAQGFAYLSVYGAILRGWALAALGQHEEGLAQMHQALTAQQEIGTEAVRPMFLALLASAYETGGQAEAGLRVVAEALALVDKHGVRYYEAELHRLQGTLHLRLTVPEASQAERCFRQAITLARHQQVKSWELRAAISLCRLWQQQGKQDDARQLLDAIYGWFTEGFDTVDMQEARALLSAWGDS